MKAFPGFQFFSLFHQAPNVPAFRPQIHAFLIPTMSGAEFEKAKAFLQTNNAAGQNVYDHLSTS